MAGGVLLGDLLPSPYLSSNNSYWLYLCGIPTIFVISPILVAIYHVD